MKRSHSGRIALPEGFETLAMCKREQNTRIKHLMAQGRADDLALAETLRNCTSKHPCGSGACRFCARSVRVRLLNNLRDLFEGNSQKLYFVTIIFYQNAIDIEGIDQWSPKLLQDRLRQQLRRAGLIGYVTGAFEVDFHSDKSCWMPHCHLLIAADKAAIEQLRPTLLKKNRSDRFEDRKLIPFHVELITNPDSAFTYPFKFMCMDRKRFQIGSASRSKKYRLPPHLHTTALKMLDRIGFSKLVFNYNADGRSKKHEGRLSSRKANKP